MIKKIFLFLGENSPYLLFYISLFLLLSKNLLIFYYIIGFIINLLINMIIKYLIKEPRPSNKYVKNFNERVKTISVDKYGMPSGHAQSIFYSFIFIHKSFNNIYLSLFYLIICLNTLYQRVNMKYHTINQVLVGSIIGLIIGYITYIMSIKKLKENKENK